MEKEKCNFKTHVVLMKGITWSRDSHGLFDYESRHLTKKTMKTQNPVQIIRKQNDLELQNHDKSLPQPSQIEEVKPLLNIINDNDLFYLESCTKPQIKVESKDLNEHMYLVEYDIQQGDILKVGRVKFAVKEIKYKVKTEIDETSIINHANVFASNDDDEFEEYEDVESIMESLPEEEQTHIPDDQLKRCRFCWGTQATPDNPLFSSCKCSGSVGYIHFACLKSWLDVKKQQKLSQNFASYYWKSFECEICKKAYPLVIRSEGRTYNLVEYQRPEGDFLVLESLNQEKNTSRIIHIITPNDKKDNFKLGRGHESDLRINDISVSRCHAIIKFKDNRFQLEDNLSKFGTLVLVKNRTMLVPGYNKAVQIGRTVINFSVKSLQANRNFGPRPQEGLIKEKFEELKEFQTQKSKKKSQDEGDLNMSGTPEQLDDQMMFPVNGNGNQIQQEQVFDMAIDQEAGVEENRNEDIPDELPDSRKTKGGHF